MLTAFRFSLAALVAAEVLVMGLALPLLWWTGPARRPAPPPAMSGPAMDRDEVLARLREVRERLRGGGDAGPVGPEEAAAEADELLFRLIVDFDLATTPYLEPSTP